MLSRPLAHHAQGRGCVCLQRTPHQCLHACWRLYPEVREGHCRGPRPPFRAAAACAGRRRTGAAVAAGSCGQAAPHAAAARAPASAAIPPQEQDPTLVAHQPLLQKSAWGHSGICFISFLLFLGALAHGSHGSATDALAYGSHGSATDAATSPLALAKAAAAATATDATATGTTYAAAGWPRRIAGSPASSSRQGDACGASAATTEGRPGERRGDETRRPRRRTRRR